MVPFGKKKSGGFSLSPLQVIVNYQSMWYIFVLNFKWSE
jgi:hypothetical protein